MKTKEQKYKEAVERNIRNLGAPKYKDSPLDLCRMKLGIRKGDTTWDWMIFGQRTSAA